MPEERNTSIRKDIAEKGREAPKKGNTHEFSSKEDELGRKGRKKPGKQKGAANWRNPQHVFLHISR